MKKRTMFQKVLAAGLCLVLASIMTACGSNNTVAKSGDEQTKVPKVEQPVSMAEEIEKSSPAETTAPTEEKAETVVVEPDSTENADASNANPESDGDYMVDGVFQLNQLMDSYLLFDISGTPTHQIGDGAVSCTFGAPEGKITIRQENEKMPISIYISDATTKISYIAEFSLEDAINVATDVDNIYLTVPVVEAVCNITPLLRERLENDECPFAGFDISHGMQGSGILETNHND